MKRNGFTKEVRFPAQYRYGEAWWAGILLMGCLYPAPGSVLPVPEELTAWSGVFHAPILDRRPLGAVFRIYY